MSMKKVQALALEIGAQVGQRWTVPDEVLRDLKDPGAFHGAILAYGRTQGQVWDMPIPALEALLGKPKKKPAEKPAEEAAPEAAPEE